MQFERIIGKLFVILGLVILHAGCAKTDSDNVKTSGFYASYSVTGNNQNSVSCTAQFQVGGPTGTYLDLSSGDTITCNGNTMSRSEFAGIITYSANVTYTVGATYSLVLTRTGESPYTSTVVLPEAIAGMNPGANFSHSKGVALTASWTPSSNASDDMQVAISFDGSNSSASYSRNDTAPENGSIGFASSELDLTTPEGGNYSGTLQYSRVRLGTMATALDGTITAKQRVSYVMTLN